MFNILRKLAPSSSDSSQNSFGYPKIPSLLDWAVSTLISSIYNNIPFFNKKKSIPESENSKEKTSKKKTNEDNIVPSSQDSPPSQKSLEPETPDTQDITTQEKQLRELFSPSSTRQFPEGYSKELQKLHKMIPEIKFKEPKDLLYEKKIPYNYYNHHQKIPQEEVERHTRLMQPCNENIIKELKKPIETPSQLISMVKKWLRFQELWGGNCNKIYYITEELHYPFYSYDNKSQPSNYKQAISISRDYDDRLYHRTLITIFQDLESLKNLILILGLEYSFTHCIKGHEGCPHTSYNLPLMVNSVEYILHKQIAIPNDSVHISTPLFHLAVKQNILSKVFFLFTNDNINCNSYNLYPDRYNGVYSIASLDTPLKIAIDNFDSANLGMLLEYGANPMLSIPDKLCVYSDYSKEITLLDYFFNIKPQPGEQTTAYIEMANLLYRSCETQEDFKKKAQEKKILIETPGKIFGSVATEENLFDHISLPKQHKSARTDLERKSGEVIPETQKVIESGKTEVKKTEIPELKNPEPNPDSVKLPQSLIAIIPNSLAFLYKQASNTQNTLPDNIPQLLDLASDNIGHCHDINSLLGAGTPIDNIAADNIPKMLSLEYTK